MIQFSFIHKKDALLFRDIAVCYRYRVIIDITASHVENPGQGIQRDNYQSVGIQPIELAKDPFDLAFGRFPGDLIRQEKNLVRRYFGAIFPYSSKRIQRGLEPYSPGIQHTLQGFGIGSGIDQSVNSHGTSATHLFNNPVSHVWCPRLPHLEEIKTGTFQFSFSLKEISGICPDPCPLPGYDGGSCRTGKSAYPFARLPLFRWILTQVRISAGDNECIQLCCLHKSPYGC